VFIVISLVFGDLIRIFGYPPTLISNSLLMSSANLETGDLDDPPKTISSTYTCTIRTSQPCLSRDKV
jgi:hypothetical protein